MSEEDRTRKERTPDDLANLVGESLDLRQAALGGAQHVEAIGQALYHLETLRLSRKLGADHPRVRRLAARSKQLAQEARALAAEREMAAVKPPAIEENEALVNGRITDRNRRGIGKLMVGLRSSDGERLSGVEDVETNAVGYYALKLSPDAAKRTAETGAVLVVMNQAGDLVHQSEEPLTPAVGARMAVDAALNRERLTGRRPGAWARWRQPGSGGEEPPGEHWVVKGRVIDANEQPVPGVMVTAHDKDQRYDDKLGSSLTNKEGEFEIRYSVRDFREGEEPGPDLYLRVIDQEGELLFSTKDDIRFDAGREEAYTIQLPQAGDDDG